MKKFLPLLLALAMALGLAAAPGQALAPGRTVLPSTPVYGEEEAAGLLTGSCTESVGSGYAPPFYGKSGLNSAEQTIYNTLKDRFTQIANGELDTSTLKLDTKGLGITGGKSGLQGASTRDIVVALLMDLPFETYWLNKSEGWTASWSYYGNSGAVTSLTIKFPVFQEYALNVPNANQFYLYRPDPEKTRPAAAIARNAQAVVQQYAGLSDYDKLAAYRDYICAQVAYDYYAAEHDNGKTGNPWQLINVFDNDPKTDRYASQKKCRKRVAVS